LQENQLTGSWRRDSLAIRKSALRKDLEDKLRTRFPPQPPKNPAKKNLRLKKNASKAGSRREGDFRRVKGRKHGQ